MFDFYTEVSAVEWRTVRLSGLTDCQTEWADWVSDWVSLPSVRLSGLTECHSVLVIAVRLNGLAECQTEWAYW